jgi:hypothetical protein
LWLHRTSGWHLEAASPLLSLTSPEAIVPMIFGSRYGDTLFKSETLSVSRGETLWHAQMPRQSSTPKMTIAEILDIVFLDILHKLLLYNAPEITQVQNFSQYFVVELSEIIQ